MSIDEKYIIEDLRKCYSEQGSFISNDRVILPSVNVSVQPEIYQLKDNMATIVYHINSPEWKNEIFEVSSSIGSDTKTAVGMAQGGFMFGIMEAVQAMMLDINPHEEESDFLGLHKWKLYLGNIVSINKNVPVESIKVYWNVLKDEILKRIGNQEICYVKIYAANGGNGKFFTGECRINDTKIESLSKIVEDMARKWNNTEFASQKQFFMLKQEEETLREYPYTDNDIQNAVEKAMILYEMVTNDNNQKYYFPTLADYLQDKTLAQDIYNFIPEICTERAIDEVTFSESVQFNIKGSIQKYYKTQLAAYYPIFNAVLKTLDKGILKDTGKVFENFIYTSAGFNAINKAIKGGSKIENLVMTDLLFNVSDDYILR